MNARLRFEVFKRDAFACQYCGRGVPDVMLEVDHIVPRAAGGTDDIANLVTACVDCNGGKSDRLLPEGTRPGINQQTVDALRERVDQTKAYHAYLAELEELRANATDRVWEAWAKAFGGRAKGGKYLCPSGFPSERTVAYFVRTLPLDLIIEAIDIAAAKIPWGGSRAQRYFYGVCYNRARERRGGA